MQYDCENTSHAVLYILPDKSAQQSENISAHLVSFECQIPNMLKSPADGSCVSLPLGCKKSSADSS